MKRILLFGFIAFLLADVQVLVAKEPVGVQPRTLNGYRVSNDCEAPSESAQLDINNVRALLHNGGDMWWDLVGNPRYEVPKGSQRHSMFASSLWIGGYDDSGNLRIAAQTYRQSGNDFWPGPLTGGETGGDAATDAETCEKWNKMYKINKAEIDAFRADWSDGTLDNAENYPNVMEWPGNASDADGVPLRAFRPDGSMVSAAPFVDVDGDPFNYNPSGGDYPDIDGDQAIWWVINDRGNQHTETGGQAIGIEIHMMAFAFTTANAVNDMTFYRQTVINRSSQVLNQTYIGQWVDSDVGKFNDDYVGCDTLRGLGYSYNADDDDDGPTGYGQNPPAVGVDFFQGPLADPFDGIDNDKDGIIDEPGETIIMSKFVYYNNDFSLIGNPEVAQHFYGYLTGFWKDGSPIVDNFTNGGDGNGYGPSSPGPVTNYMFPGDACAATGWTEENADNPRNEDRRFLQSAGPFTLQPGAVNEIVTGVVWARGYYNDQFGSVCELLAADDIAQALFDANFQLLDGPDAPQASMSEYDRELMLSWGYGEEVKTVRNNFNESYLQADPVLKAQGEPDSLFEFQGYIVYQLQDATVGPNELNDPDRARVVAQCDVKDGVSSIVNRVERAVEGLSQPVIADEVMVEGADDGIFHSVRITRDLFAQGSETGLKNYTPYYFAVIAYAYNDVTSDGRKFVPGNRFFEVIEALPHPIEQEAGGMVTNSSYSDGLLITQIGGVGNGGNFVRITEETEADILENTTAEGIQYQSGAAPISVRVVDPKQVKPLYYRLVIPQDSLLELEEVTADGTVIDSVFTDWMLFESSSPNVSISGTPVYTSTYKKRNDGTAPRPAPLTKNDVVIRDRGISILIGDINPAGDTLDIEGRMGLIGGETSFEDITAPWLTGLPDNEEFGGGIWNWITDGEDRQLDSTGLFVWDKWGDYQTVNSGRWAPYILGRSFSNASNGGDIAPTLPVKSPSSNRQVSPFELIDLSELPDVDIVFTNDPSKWSRCMVIETSPNSSLGSGAWPMSAKYRTSLDIDGNPESGMSPTEGGPYGMSWFPGYAINVNTGERLNIFFGESDWDQVNNGNDMIFNPTSDFGNNLTRAGGRHYVYVTNLPYDGCESIKDTLMNADDAGTSGFAQAIFFDRTGHNLKDVYKHVAWVGIPMLANGFDFNNPLDIPTDARVSLRVNQPFRSRTGLNDVPEFTFNTIEEAVEIGVTSVAEEALEKVLVVPNPYYAYSSYEGGQLENRVKFTNLPQKAKISIFTLNGMMVRQYTKDSDSPEQEWDLKNKDGVPVASGVYIIHVDANVGDQQLGEKIIKLFAVMRQTDLDNF
ncbi:T9SS type A sorting domain-containing protein [Pontibacter sp. G13]|uniref:T9SS type A sorting domain-containing protein n=1 Tax=Pontibacter sp. G13 TaxID=3074898 RepID=UPI00288BDF32|nr:T9SS type A sorting domain-containing protein [Pontibacter sp. G13]WNJ20157.1 T9SS type A sorting domain-containing protein [Pontibacter sp. G13]